MKTSEEHDSKEMRAVETTTRVNHEREITMNEETARPQSQTEELENRNETRKEKEITMRDEANNDLQVEAKKTKVHTPDYSDFELEDMDDENLREALDFWAVTFPRVDHVDYYGLRIPLTYLIESLWNDDSRMDTYIRQHLDLSDKYSSYSRVVRAVKHDWDLYIR